MSDEADSSEIGRYAINREIASDLWYVAACDPDYLSAGHATRAAAEALAARLDAEDERRADALDQFDR